MLMALLSVSQCLAWTTVPLASIRQQQRLRMPKSVLQMSDQWDDEPELPAAPTEPVPEKIASGPWKVEGTFEPDELEELFRKNDLTTYDEANSAMVDEKEQKELEAMGGADNYIPGVSTCVYERALTWSQLTTNRWGQHGTNSTHTHTDILRMDQFTLLLHHFLIPQLCLLTHSTPPSPSSHRSFQYTVRTGQPRQVARPRQGANRVTGH